MTERISELIACGDEIVLEGLDNPFDPAEIKEVTLKKLHETTRPSARVRVRKVSRTLLFAALLSTLFVTSALAVGLSPTRSAVRRRQALVEKRPVVRHDPRHAACILSHEGVAVLVCEVAVCGAADVRHRLPVHYGPLKHVRKPRRLMRRNRLLHKNGAAIGLMPRKAPSVGVLHAVRIKLL